MKIKSGGVDGGVQLGGNDYTNKKNIGSANKTHTTSLFNYFATFFSTPSPIKKQKIETNNLEKLLFNNKKNKPDGVLSDVNLFGPKSVSCSSDINTVGVDSGIDKHQQSGENKIVMDHAILDAIDKHKQNGEKKIDVGQDIHETNAPDRVSCGVNLFGQRSVSCSHDINAVGVDSGITDKHQQSGENKTTVMDHDTLDAIITAATNRSKKRPADSEAINGATSSKRVSVASPKKTIINVKPAFGCDEYLGKIARGNEELDNKWCKILCFRFMLFIRRYYDQKFHDRKEETKNKFFQDMLINNAENLKKIYLPRFQNYTFPRISRAIGPHFVVSNCLNIVKRTGKTFADAVIYFINVLKKSKLNFLTVKGNVVSKSYRHSASFAIVKSEDENKFKVILYDSLNNMPQEIELDMKKLDDLDDAEYHEAFNTQMILSTESLATAYRNEEPQLVLYECYEVGTSQPELDEKMFEPVPEDNIKCVLADIGGKEFMADADTFRSMKSLITVAGNLELTKMILDHTNKDLLDLLKFENTVWFDIAHVKGNPEKLKELYAQVFDLFSSTINKRYIDEDSPTITTKDANEHFANALDNAVKYNNFVLAEFLIMKKVPIKLQRTVDKINKLDSNDELTITLKKYVSLRKF